MTVITQNTNWSPLVNVPNHTCMTPSDPELYCLTSYVLLLTLQYRLSKEKHPTEARHFWEK